MFTAHFFPWRADLHKPTAADYEAKVAALKASHVSAPAADKSNGAVDAEAAPPVQKAANDSMPTGDSMPMAASPAAPAKPPANEASETTAADAAPDATPEDAAPQQASVFATSSPAPASNAAKAEQSTPDDTVPSADTAAKEASPEPASAEPAASPSPNLSSITDGVGCDNARRCDCLCMPLAACLWRRVCS
jgi:nicotinate-nucleotide--dimethylbenzimidazole phosphoribosyltransferase